ncbi:DNA cytosine methyltransferase [Amycolatopsis palatopharyngis]|uniref:DNA cytosine methyltransferase n=1 Tax=Amycolatopsis palatopharyngis TaxID=187982 RepID=UPI001FEB6A43|nr:DNA cytosine methyltransferase [Amycolatopsis palatopharyngis]
MRRNRSTSHARGSSAADGLRFVATEGAVIGSLCTGLAGLDVGVASVLGGRIAWYAETDPHASAILAARLPGVANLGDLRAVDFTAVQPIEVLTAGFPCQDISAAGRRAGIEKGARSGLWNNILDAIRVLRPNLVVVENVAALRWRNGGLDRVLGGLAEAGCDAVWRCVRASDIGAAHRRERVFLCAVPQQTRGTDDADPAGPRPGTARPDRPRRASCGRASGQPQRRRRLGDPTAPAAADTDSGGLTLSSDPDRPHTGPPIPTGCVTLTDSVRLLPTPTASDAKNCTHETHSGGPSLPDRARTLTTPPVPEQSGKCCAATQTPGEGGFLAASPQASGGLLPTPTAHDGSSNGISAASRQGGPSLLDTLRLLPTPRATDGTKGCPAQRGSKGDLMLPSVVIAVTTPHTRTSTRKEMSDRANHARASRARRVASGKPSPVDWGEYAAVHRWEVVTRRLAPYPTQPGRHGRPVLAPPFVEWLMGLPAGWVTAENLDLPRTAQLRALGNGVMPQQAAHALRLLLDDLTHLHRPPPCRPPASTTRDIKARASRARARSGSTRPSGAARVSTPACGRRSGTRSRR